MRVIRLIYIIEIFWTVKNIGISNLLAQMVRNLPAKQVPGFDP